MQGCADLEQEVADLQAHIVAIESREKKRGEDDASKHNDEVGTLRAQNSAWKEQLELLLSAPRK